MSEAGGVTRVAVESTALLAIRWRRIDHIGINASRDDHLPNADSKDGRSSQKDAAAVAVENAVRGVKKGNQHRGLAER